MTLTARQGLGARSILAAVTVAATLAIASTASPVAAETKQERYYKQLATEVEAFEAKFDQFSWAEKLKIVERLGDGKVTRDCVGANCKNVMHAPINGTLIGSIELIYVPATKYKSYCIIDTQETVRGCKSETGVINVYTLDQDEVWRPLNLK